MNRKDDPFFWAQCAIISAAVGFAAIPIATITGHVLQWFGVIQ